MEENKLDTGYVFPLFGHTHTHTHTQTHTHTTVDKQRAAVNVTLVFIQLFGFFFNNGTERILGFPERRDVTLN
jgi:hypothetical protein